MNESSTKLPVPVPESQRIESINVLRGVAVLGILALNIQSFAMPGAAYMNPTAYGNLEGVNYWIWYFTHLLGDMKFWSIFAMLFGAGVIIMTQRCETTGRSAMGIHYRRMLWLLLFGLLHAHLVWYGDILYTYAMCGLVIYFFRKLSPVVLVCVGMILLLIAFGISLGFGALLTSVPEMRNEMAEGWTPGSQQIQDELEIYRGGWVGQLGHRMTTAFFFETFLFLINFGWRSMGLMLIGMALYKWDVFSASRSRSFYAAMLTIAVGIGLPLIAFGVYRNQVAQWTLEYSFFYGPLYNFWGSILVALGWVAGVMLVCKSPALRPLTMPFAATGRMALTAYLLQSLIATAIFYGHGLGQFGYFERWQQALTVVGVWVFLLIFSPLWLCYFRYGPFEWLWRSLTYLKLQPFRKRGSPAA